MSDFLFKDRDGQTPLPRDLHKGLKIKTIQTMGELDEYEEQNIAKGLSWLARQERDPCTYDYWITLHKRMFEEVWSWAGKVRTHQLGNPNFHEPHEIWPNLYQLEKDLNTWIKQNTYQPREIAARFHERIETIHPFPNGNGRLGRILTEQICTYHSWDIPTWAKKLQNDLVERRRVYIEALLHAEQQKDYTTLIEVMFS